MSCPYIAKKDGDWYCTAQEDFVSYDSYCSYNYEACRHYNKANGGCFLSTACVEYKGLADDCYELTTLREFRDNYLLGFEEGKLDVEEYYRIAPKIVSLISLSPCADMIFEDIYNMMLLCVECIENGRYEEAHSLYKDFVMKLKEKFE